ncbi:hypothetical protein OG402_11815 [Streptomyces anulatus]|uniref:hypothetical protein n=1 Tax=Streptomyces anulatus TaxID=1892 RepID=UPI0022509067|nr:hypothetical protein [Streptomyces anulatus]MCX4601174.1 hypothetical protein [Streptomyces anulatus]
MSDDQNTTGPIPVYVRVVPTAVVLDLEALTRLVVGDVVNALLDPEDTGLWDRLHELADTERATPEEGRLPYEELVAALTDRASSRVPLTVGRARDLSTTLRMLADRLTIPRQQDGRWAA